MARSPGQFIYFYVVHSFHWELAAAVSPLPAATLYHPPRPPFFPGLPLLCHGNCVDQAPQQPPSQRLCLPQCGLLPVQPPPTASARGGDHLPTAPWRAYTFQNFLLRCPWKREGGGLGPCKGRKGSNKKQDHLPIFISFFQKPPNPDTRTATGFCSPLPWEGESRLLAATESICHCRSLEPSCPLRPLPPFAETACSAYGWKLCPGKTQKVNI